jgi:hypothetical protein
MDRIERPTEIGRCCGMGMDVGGKKNERDEMGGACNTYGGEERCIQEFGGVT